jgi:hypothetical protein
MYLRQTSVDACGGLQIVTYRHNHPCEENLSLVLGQLKGVGRGAPRLHGVHQLGKAIQTRTAAHDRSLYVAEVCGAESNHQRAVFQTHALLRPALLQQRPLSNLEPGIAKNGVLFRLFLVFLFARRRRTAPRFYPIPNEMNVKRGSKPTAEKTKNQRKT